MNPRYIAYLKTTNTPTNWGFMAFISKMVKDYGEKYLIKDSTGYYNIDNQDKFTQFIVEQVN